MSDMSTLPRQCGSGTQDPDHFGHRNVNYNYSQSHGEEYIQIVSYFLCMIIGTMSRSYVRYGVSRPQQVNFFGTVSRCVTWEDILCC